MSYELGQSKVEYSKIRNFENSKFRKLAVYTKSIYFCKNIHMKTLSLKLDEDIFDETEKITSKMNLTRNRYINEALKIYNLYNKKKLLKAQLVRESKLTSKDSMDVLKDFELLIDGN